MAATPIIGPALQGAMVAPRAWVRSFSAPCNSALHAGRRSQRNESPHTAAGVMSCGGWRVPVRRLDAAGHWIRLEFALEVQFGFSVEVRWGDRRSAHPGLEVVLGVGQGVAQPVRHAGDAGHPQAFSSLARQAPSSAGCSAGSWAKQRCCSSPLSWRKRPGNL